MSIEELTAKLALAPSKQAVLSRVEEALLALFAAERARVFQLASLPPSGRAVMEENPVAQMFLREETALHEAQVVDNATWRRLCPRADHGHVLVGPLLARGEVWGILAVTRETTSFGPLDLKLMNRLSLDVSTRMAELEAVEAVHPWECLSAREAEVASLAGQGLRNREIALSLTISEHTVKQNMKSIFRKLDLRSRTELALIARRA